jgi:hypothetical protein
MEEEMIATQVVLLLLTAPLLLLLAALMWFHDPVTKPGLWRALTALVVVLAAVSLRDAYLIEQSHVSSWLGFALRTAKFVTVGICLWFAASERGNSRS